MRLVTMNRLETVVVRQRKSRSRDLIFATFIATIALVGGTTVGVSIHDAVTCGNVRSRT